MEKYTGFVMVLFFLSMICERVSDFLKHFLSGDNGPIGKFIGKILGIGDMLTKSPNGSKAEDQRYYRILKMNVICGLGTALILHADIFTIFLHISDPGKSLGWGKITWFWQAPDKMGALKILLQGGKFFIGCVATGFFISFGSKFWHDMLDTLFEIKNYRRLLADPNTFQTDNIQAFDRLQKTFGSDIEAKAKAQLMADPDVISAMSGTDDQGDYIEVTLKQDSGKYQNPYSVKMDDGSTSNIRLVKVIAGSDEIVAHSINLADKVFNTSAPAAWGTIGCLVNKKNVQGTFVLTCFHNVAEPGSNFVFSSADPNNSELLNDVSAPSEDITGKVFTGVLDTQIDAALVKIGNDDVNNITNQLPGSGTPTGVRPDVTTGLAVSMYGRKSGPTNGKVTGLASANVKYGNNKVIQFTNLIAVSNNGKAISTFGDSGSVLLDDSQEIVGLIVAGNSKTSYAVPATAIFDRLSLTLVTS